CLVKKIIILLILLGVGGGLGWWYWQRSGDPPSTFRTAAVKRGDLQVTISATGTIEPEEVVDVGAQVAGIIRSFGPDPHDSTKTVDYRTAVEKGTELARIDDSLYQAAVEQAQAQVGQARANLQRAQADLVQMKAKYRQADRDWSRARV